MTAILLAPHSEQIAWAAGLFEGEGCARARKLDKRHTYPQPQPYVNLRMCDEEPVREFARIMGFGNVNRRKNGSGLPHHRDLWCWESGSKGDIPRMAVLLPLLSPRRQVQLRAALDVCVFADPDLKRERLQQAWANRPSVVCSNCGRTLRVWGRHRQACKGVMGT